MICTCGHAHEAHAGSSATGECLFRGCDCVEFSPDMNTCANCRHGESEHVRELGDGIFACGHGYCACKAFVRLAQQ